MHYNCETFKNYVEEFITVLSVERNLSQNTLKAYRYDLSSLNKWLASASCSSFDRDTLLAYFDMLQKEKRLKPRSLLRKYISISQFCRYLNTFHYTEDPFVRFGSRKFQLPETLPKVLTRSELRSLLSVTETEYNHLDSPFRKTICIRDAVILELLYCLGLRISEIRNLNLEDYDPESQALLIHGKGKKERFLCISSQEVIRKLEHWLSLRDSLSPKDNAIFINKFGNRLSIYTIENLFNKYKEKSMISTSATPHSLRHTFATHLLNNGANIRDVQELLGHKSITTTQIYTEVSLERKKYVLAHYNGRNTLFQ